MNGEDIAIEQLKSWLKDVKRISHELRELPSSEKQTFYDNKLDDVLAHLQAARAGLVEIAHAIQRERD
ncbi:MAG: hypothetical protein KME05_10280 [Gloeocapsa sp. UFS-A4-WI-NPMV-4B04]|jgi:hypothetical protein|nr:hypothetical protein [Gloeocapsa sp. UFS-A4-WI-NPMV-4B04]